MGEQSRSPGRPPGPCRLGPVLKAGWLRKQRSIMKNWQQRWFVLRGNQLFYYKDKDETKPQGFISLQGTQVTELLPGPEDPGKHLFEISPGRIEHPVLALMGVSPCPLLGKRRSPCCGSLKEFQHSLQAQFRDVGLKNSAHWEGIRQSTKVIV
ncbi:Hypothetical predicted protein [Marmota monax]|uniref:PH domain-containing protein n=1 Tax=Marmota monax TaxID=9995 RepID=A0A5E4BIK1_MARMO|nr:hypothetical protein GHT09_005684 [Marmota monax]VTJ69398.1 Hypothetical predicted protein [Marmota monax]